MKTVSRKVGLLVAALVLAAVLILAVGSPRQTNASCEGDVSWNIWQELDDSQTSDTKGGKTTDTQSISSRTELQSDNGQSITDNTTHYTNADGSSHEHEDINYSDSEGKRCDSDGLPMKESHTRDEDTDSKGNTKEHIEEIKEKNRKCVKWVWDREWDSKGKLVKENESTTEIPCSKYNLQVSFNGTKSSGNMTAVYGPNTIIIHLEDKGKIYEGKYESVLAGNVKGFCNGSITWPVLIEVTATKYEEKKELVFSVKTTMDKPWTPGTCKNLSGNMRAGAITVPLHLFRIAEEGGASFSVTEEPITWTYTLVQK